MELPKLAYFHKYIRIIFRAAVRSVDPKVLVRKNVRIVDKELGFKVGSFEGPVYRVKHNIYICGFGKAVAPMAAQLQELFRPHVEKGVISVPSGFTEFSEKLEKRRWLPEHPIEVIEGAAGNIPDENSLEASGKIVKLIKGLSENDILFVLISGGGSALCPMPKPPLTLSEKRQIIQHLSKAGATIQELNKVRIRLSALKGGKLLKHTKAQVISLILSDIVGDPLDLIASGPTVESRISSTDAIEVLEKYDFKISETLRGVIETEPDDRVCSSFSNHLIGSNRVALDAAKLSAKSYGFHTIVATDRLTGEAREVAKKIVKIVDGDCSGLGLSAAVEEELRSLPKDTPICVLFGGETTVTVTGEGKGGRNLEMALAAGMALEEQQKDVVFLSGGTDGIDGPTDVAGAIVDQTYVKFKRQKGFDPLEYLNNNDSYTFFHPPDLKPTAEEFYAILKTGHTGTNVMDVQALMFLTDA
ncbi:glycerate kinase [Galendromus occidentalis]|uniref:Glycerate kinase n=1 Tax=Galendromus occidentalis TaxID=34638 RepID=A0AAJ6VXY6_9ACAR|nr:glycerate kinase [Galendromus occidentalis]